MAPWHSQSVAAALPRLKAWLAQPRHALSALLAATWLFFALEWLWAHNVPSLLRWVVFTLGLVVGVAAIVKTWRMPVLTRAVVGTAALLPIWQWLVFVPDFLGASGLVAVFATLGLAAYFAIGLCWTVWGVERGSRHYLDQRADRSPSAAHGAASVHAARVQAVQIVGFDRGNHAAAKPIWNPIDLQAWYYGRRKPKLNQSLTTLFAYCIAFFLLVYLFNVLGGCQEIYEMPAGGGGNSKGDKENSDQPQVVQVQRIIRKKFVINPFSSIQFNIAPIENVPLNLKEVTKHGYQIGQGKGSGAGFSGGTFRGKVRFIRLEYKGGDWDQDFGVGADLNMLLRYGIETGHQINEKTESRTVEELARFPVGKSPPFVYITGQQTIQLSKRETEILREYLIDKHGMIFCDNGGSAQFHAQFFSMMDKVLEGTGVYPVKVPLDDVIHRIPFTLPFLPYVAPHGGKDAYGWYKDGRWLAYYHPGDIGDAWSDGHAGVRKEIYEACYHLGVNVMFYAHAEYNKWLESREKKE